MPRRDKINGAALLDFGCARIERRFDPDQALMFKFNSLLLLLLLILPICLPAQSTNQSAQQNTSRAAADRLGAKLDHIRSNGEQSHPDQNPTVLAEEEINSYFAEGRVKLPSGVQKASYLLQPGIVTADTRVDFDQLKAGRSSSNPLLSIFSGVHNVQAIAHATGSGGIGRVHIDSVALDNAEIPRFLLKIFLEKFVQPKYPRVSLDSEFKLPAKIDLATIGEHKLTLTQK